MVFENTAVELKLRELDEYLKNHSYLNGPEISPLDIQTLLDLTSVTIPNLSKYPHVLRWHTHLSTSNELQSSSTNENSSDFTSLLPESNTKKISRDPSSTYAHHTQSNLLPSSVAYLGPASSFSHSAAETYFPKTSTFLPTKSIPGVFSMVLANEATFGVVPIENSIGGRIIQTLEGFRNPEIKIQGQVHLPISHHLISKIPFSSVKRIYSHPQALAQCANFLLRHCSEAETIPASSTARAAEMAAEEEGAAAISSQAAAEHFGLNILFDNIQDEEENVTRFLIISKSALVSVGRDTKTFMLIQTLNTAGSLAKVLLVFSQYNISLSRLESFPSKDNQGVFNFWAELEGDPTQGPLKEAVGQLKAVTTSFRILGTFSDSN